MKCHCLCTSDIYFSFVYIVTQLIPTVARFYKHHIYQGCVLVKQCACNHSDVTNTAWVSVCVCTCIQSLVVTSATSYSPGNSDWLIKHITTRDKLTVTSFSWKHDTRRRRLWHRRTRSRAAWYGSAWWGLEHCYMYAPAQWNQELQDCTKNLMLVLP